MSQRVNDFIAILFATVGAFIVVMFVSLFGLSLYSGNATIPESAQEQFWNIVTGLAVVAATAVMGYLTNRNSLANQAQSLIDAKETREAVAASAVGTQAKVEEVVGILHNGLKKEIADTTAGIVDKNAQRTAELLKENLSSADTISESRRIEAAAIANATRLESNSDLKAQLVLLNAKLDALAANKQPAPMIVGPMMPAAPTMAPSFVQPQSQPIASPVTHPELPEVIKDNTTTIQSNTEATLVDTQTRLDAVEQTTSTLAGKANKQTKPESEASETT